jgi:hypothetical protein
MKFVLTDKRSLSLPEPQEPRQSVLQCVCPLLLHLVTAPREKLKAFEPAALTLKKIIIIIITHKNTKDLKKPTSLKLVAVF